MTIGILGFGEMGKALNAVLASNTDIARKCWDKNADILPQQEPLTTMIPSCDVLFVCVPTWLVRSALQEVHHLLKPEAILVSLSKGFEKETCTRVDKLFATVCQADHAFVFLGGPMIAEELVAGTKSTAIATSTHPESLAAIAKLFENTTLSVEINDDVEGIITAASLKNIYALGIGIGDGLNIGSNGHGILIAKAAREMMHLVVAHGGRAESALGLAGLADLVATAQSPNSTNYTTGIRLARNQPPLRGSEAMNTIPCIATTMIDILDDLPFLKAIHDIVVKHAPASESLAAILSTP
jgi:glycerol-3-phosphate dehydrogenase (NAD(P)+)